MLMFKANYTKYNWTAKLKFCFWSKKRTFNICVSYWESTNSNEWKGPSTSLTIEKGKKGRANK